MKPKPRKRWSNAPKIRPEFWRGRKWARTLEYELGLRVMHSLMRENYQRPSARRKYVIHHARPAVAIALAEREIA